MQPRRPALRLPNLRARLFQRPALEVVALKELLLLLRELLYRRPDPVLRLLLLHPDVHRQRLVGVARRVRPFQARREHHREPGHRIRDVTDIIVKRAAAVACSRLAVGKIAQVRRRPLPGKRRAGIRAPQDSHLPQAVEDGALDAVVREGEEVGSHLRVEPLGGLQQAYLSVGHQLIELELGVELLADGRRQRPHVGPVLLEDDLPVVAQSQAQLTRPWTTAAREPGSAADHPAAHRRSCW